MKFLEKINNIGGSVSYFILCTVMLLSSLFYLPFVGSQASQSWMIISGLSLSFFIFFLSRIINGNLKINKNFLSIVLISLIFFIFFSSFFSLNPKVSFWGEYGEIGTAISYITIIIGILFTSQVFENNRERIFYIINFYLLSFLVYLVLLCLRVFTPILTINSNGFFDPVLNIFSSEAELSLLLGLTLLVSNVSLSFLKSSSFYKYLLYVVYAISGIMLIVFNSTTSAILVIIFSIINIFLLLRDTRKGLPLIIISLLLGIIALFGPYYSQYINKYLGINVNQSVSSTYSFKESINQIGKGLSQNFVFGVGPNRFFNNFGLNLPVQDKNFVGEDVLYNTNKSTILTFWATTGFINILLSIVFFFALLYYLFRVILEKNDNVFDRYISVVTLNLSLYFIISAFVINISYVFALLFIIAIGILISILSRGRVKDSFFVVSILPKSFFHFCYLVIIFAIIALSIYNVFISSRQVISLYNMNYGLINYDKDVVSAKKHIERAISLYPNAVYYRNLIDIEKNILINSINTNSQTKNKSKEIQEQEIEVYKKILENGRVYGEKAINTDPWDFRNFFSLAAFYTPFVSLGDSAEVLEIIDGLYAKAEALIPNSTIIDNSRAQTYLSINKVKEAQVFVDKVLAKRPNNLNALSSLRQIKLNSKDTKGLKEVLSNILNINPRYYDLWYELAVIAFNEKDYKNAISYAENSLQINPKFANAVYVHAMSLFSLGEKTAAIEELNYIKTLDPQNTEIDAIIKNLTQVSTSTSKTKTKKK